MTYRSDVAPETLQISLEPEGVEVTYLDGRSVFYHGVPAPREGSVVCGPGKDVHVLVTSPDEREGVMVYLNDRDTHDDILETTGVGRVVLDRGETTSLFPGVEGTNHGYRIEVTADPETARGRVFVFSEDARGESSYEIVAAADGDDDGVDATDTTDEDRDGTADAHPTATTDDPSETTNDDESGTTDDDPSETTNDDESGTTDDDPSEMTTEKKDGPTDGNTTRTTAGETTDRGAVGIQ